MDDPLTVRDAALDLLLGSCCVVCTRPGRALCAACRARLPVDVGVRWPTPVPPGLAPPVAAGEYAGPLRDLVLAHKERGRFALAAPLGDLLARSVRELLRLTARPDSSRVLLVPVPSRRATVRARGHDPLLRISRRAAGSLRAQGIRAEVLPVLRLRRRVLDQSGLDAWTRGENLAGSMGRPRGRPLTARADDAVIVVDDVLTTGATAREAQRACEETPGPEKCRTTVLGVSVVAATRLRVADSR